VLQGRTRRIAIVAMARKLLIALWRCVEAGVMLDGVQFSRIPPAWAAGVYERLFRRSRIVGSCLCISMRSLRVSIPKFVNASTPSSPSP
jgi:hypothetical protein